MTKNIIGVIRSLYSELICPQICVLCGQETKQAVSICKNCSDDFFQNCLEEHYSQPENFCVLCGRQLISEIKICRPCKDMIANNDKPHYDKLYTLFPYIAKGQKIVPEWKNIGLRGYADLYAQFVFDFILHNPGLQNVPLVPIPPRPKKIKERGWDQIDDLCNQLKKYKSLKVIKCLKRLDGKPQKSFSREGRKTNILNKFYVKKKFKNKIPETVILIDDVTTTGATVSECARILKESGCKTVLGICLFFD